MAINYDIVYALYDGGWRSADKDLLISYADDYGFTIDEIDGYINALAELDESLKANGYYESKEG